MSGVNKAILVGHLGGKPEIKRTQDGRPVATFSVATGKSWRDKTTGERKEQTQWHRIVVFNEGLCKIVEQYLDKGSKVYVEGEICTRKWVDQGGNEKWVTEIVLSAFGSSIQMLDRAEGRPTPSESDYGAQTTGGTPGAGAGGKRADLDDEIPF